MYCTRDNAPSNATNNPREKERGDVETKTKMGDARACIHHCKTRHKRGLPRL